MPEMMHEGQYVWDRDREDVGVIARLDPEGGEADLVPLPLVGGDGWTQRLDRLSPASAAEVIWTKVRARNRSSL